MGPGYFKFPLYSVLTIDESLCSEHASTTDGLDLLFSEFREELGLDNDLT